MKKIAALAAVVAITFSLAACAQNSAKDTKVKCPACGYEFMVPTDR